MKSTDTTYSSVEMKPNVFHEGEIYTRLDWTKLFATAEHKVVPSTATRAMIIWHANSICDETEHYALRPHHFEGFCMFGFAMGTFFIGT